MKAIVVKAPGLDFELIEKEIPEPGEHEVLLKVQACGVCHGNAIVKEGFFPRFIIP
jgi:alcohol dehydrogenase, propanol-preferring